MSWRTDADVLSMSCPAASRAMVVDCCMDADALSINCRADVDALSSSWAGDVDALAVSCLGAAADGLAGLMTPAVTCVEAFRTEDSQTLPVLPPTSRVPEDRLDKEGCAVSSVTVSDSVVTAWFV